MNKNKKDIIILAIETSCDETAAAVVRNGRDVLSNIVASQIDLHKIYGGVVPEIASRKHVELIIPVVEEAVLNSGVLLNDIDAIAVTYGPGLVGALLVGVSAAKSIAFALNKKLIGVHHTLGHIAANYINHKELEPPFICLIVSGGHTSIVHVKEYNEYEILGQTRDDAAGEAFDKIARAIGFGYPGGPLIEKAALEGNPEAYKFPRVRFKDGTVDFSFSGPKTAVLNAYNKAKQQGLNINKSDIAASFQKAVVDILVENTLKAAIDRGCYTVCIAGGVAANKYLRNEMSIEMNKNNIKFLYPDINLCTDNAAMIGCIAYYEYLKGNFKELDLNAIPNLKV